MSSDAIRAGRLAGQGRVLMRLPEVMAACGMSRSLIYKLAKEQRFPRPIRIAARLSAWDSEAVQAWIDAKCTAGRKPDGC